VLSRRTSAFRKYRRRDEVNGIFEPGKKLNERALADANKTNIHSRAEAKKQTGFLLGAAAGIPDARGGFTRLIW
jgi:hypothetical protein